MPLKFASSSPPSAKEASMAKAPSRPAMAVSRSRTPEEGAPAFLVVLPDGSLRIWDVGQLTAAEVHRQYPGHQLRCCASPCPHPRLPPSASLAPDSTYFLAPSPSPSDSCQPPLRSRRSFAVEDRGSLQGSFPGALPRASTESTSSDIARQHARLHSRSSSWSSYSLNHLSYASECSVAESDSSEDEESCIPDSHNGRLDANAAAVRRYSISVAAHNEWNYGGGSQPHSSTSSSSRSSSNSGSSSGPACQALPSANQKTWYTAGLPPRAPTSASGPVLSLVNRPSHPMTFMDMYPSEPMPMYQRRAEDPGRCTCPCSHHSAASSAGTEFLEGTIDSITILHDSLDTDTARCGPRGGSGSQKASRARRLSGALFRGLVKGRKLVN